MSPSTHFDAESALETINALCTVSDFLDPTIGAGFNNDGFDIERYVSLGQRRLAVVSDRFEKLHYRTVTQNFDFRGAVATNALFMSEEIPDGAILFVGHHDYCAGLGAEDNASALAVMLELARCLEQDRARVIFASFDLEELGLFGSSHFVATLPDKQLQRIAAVAALECLGSGRDVVICQSVVGAKSDSGLVSALQRCAERLGHSIAVKEFDWFNSDHVPFAERGVRTVEICSFNEKNYRGHSDPSVNVAHSSLDIPSSILPSTLEVVGQILLQFVGNFQVHR